MPKITFPDGRSQFFEEGVNGLTIAESISKSLIKEAVAVSINGMQKDYAILLMMMQI